MAAAGLTALFTMASAGTPLETEPLAYIGGTLVFGILLLWLLKSLLLSGIIHI